MAAHFLSTLFSPGAEALQDADGSRDGYRRMIDKAAPGPDRLGQRELAFIAARDSFYMASVGNNGWPYVQHRGGPAGFLKDLGDNRIGFADFTGNRQFISTANIAADDRVALFLMDYPGRQRLKLIGHARWCDPADEMEMASRLVHPDYGAEIKRLFAIDVAGFDWNCPQHITPRFTEDEIAEATTPLREENEALRARIAQLEAKLSPSSA